LLDTFAVVAVYNSNVKLESATKVSARAATKKHTMVGKSILREGKHMLGGQKCTN